MLLYGTEARVFLISALLDELALDARTTKSRELHASLLAHELNEANKRPNFKSLICQALGDKKSRCDENFLLNLFKTLKLNTQQQIDIALCLAELPAGAAAANKFLATKLPELEVALLLYPSVVVGVLADFYLPGRSSLSVIALRGSPPRANQLPVRYEPSDGCTNPVPPAQPLAPCRRFRSDPCDAFASFGNGHVNFWQANWPGHPWHGYRCGGILQVGDA